MENIATTVPETKLSGGTGNDYSVSPEIEAATKGMPRFIQQGAEGLRRTYNPSMGAGAAGELESRIANKLKFMYGQENLRDMTDADIIEGYRRSKMPDLNMNDAVVRMHGLLLPEFNDHRGILGGIAHGAGEMVGGLVRDIAGTTLSALPLTFNAVTGNANFQSLDAAVKRFEAAGVPSTDPRYQELVKARNEQQLALRGTTELLGPAAAVLGANLLTGGLAKGVEAGVSGVLEAGAPLLSKLGVKGGINPVVNWVARNIVKQSAKGAADMALWEGSKELFLGRPADILPSAWRGATTGAIVGPLFHGVGTGASAVTRRVGMQWNEAFPNLVHQTFREDGSALFDKLKQNTTATVKDFKIDLTQDLPPQVQVMLDKLYGEEIKTTVAGKKFIDDMVAHLTEFADKNPDVVAASKGATPPVIPGAPSAPPGGGGEVKQPVGAGTPESELPKTFTGTNGQQVVIKSPKTPLKFLESIYNRVDETTNPELKEAIWREILSRNRDVKHTDFKKVPPPSWRQSGGGAGAVDPHALPEGWGTSPTDVFFNPDTPTEEAFSPGGAIDPHPRWRQTPELVEEPNQAPRVRTIRDDLAHIADDLVNKVDESQRIPEPDRPRPHPGWGELHWATTPEERFTLIDAVEEMNKKWGPGSAELVHDTGHRAAMRINSELEAHVSRGGTPEGYKPWRFIGENPPEVARFADADALVSLKIVLRKMGLTDDPMPISSPDGRIYMTTIDEFAQELLDNARANQKPTSRGAAGRAEWFNERAETEARAEDAARPVAKPGEPVKQAAGAAPAFDPNNPHHVFMSEIGRPVLNKGGKEIPGLRLIADMKVKVGMNHRGDAVAIGKVGHNIPEPQLRAILARADANGIVVERTINDTPENESKVKLLTDFGFIKSRVEDGATVFRRESRTQTNAATAPTPENQQSPPPQAPVQEVTPKQDAAPGQQPPAQVVKAPKRDLGGKQIAIKLHVPPGAKKSDIIKMWGDKAKELHLLLRKEGDSWVVAFDPRRVQLHAQGYEKLTGMGLPDTHFESGGWWDPKSKKYEVQDVYNDKSPHAGTTAPTATPEEVDSVVKKYTGLVSKKESWPDAGDSPEAAKQKLDALAPRLYETFTKARAANLLAKMFSNHDYNNLVSNLAFAYESYGNPIPVEIAEIIGARRTQRSAEQAAEIASRKK